MQLNKKKSTLIHFCFARNVDFYPHVRVEGNSLQVVSESKVLGIVIQDSSKLDHHIQHICLQTEKNLFLVANMMVQKLDYKIILDVYLKEIWSVSE